MPLPGTFFAQKKDGSTYYRASITYRSKHISLGSFLTEERASLAYQLAVLVLSDGKHFYDEPLQEIEAHKSIASVLSFEKWVMLINLRDHGMYCRNPIYLQKRFFFYYISASTALKFDVDDLFYYMNHKIMKRGGHLFVSDYGMQVNILSRYGIKNYAVSGRDFVFANHDTTDFRYGNINIVNHYHGVSKGLLRGQDVYTARIHINGDYIIGRYPTETEAAIAYNKAAETLRSQGICKDYPENYIEHVDAVEYASIYHRIRISRKLRSLHINAD